MSLSALCSTIHCDIALVQLGELCILLGMELPQDIWNFLPVEGFRLRLFLGYMIPLTMSEVSRVANACWISFIFQRRLRTIGVMLSTARHTAKLSDCSRACAFERKHFFFQLISTSNLQSNSTEYKIREFIHLHKDNNCAIIFNDMQIE